MREIGDVKRLAAVIKKRVRRPVVNELIADVEADVGQKLEFAVDLQSRDRLPDDRAVRKPQHRLELGIKAVAVAKSRQRNIRRVSSMAIVVQREANVVFVIKLFDQQQVGGSEPCRAVGEGAVAGIADAHGHRADPIAMLE